MPQMSASSNIDNALRRFSSVSIMQTLSYPLYFLANLLATLANVLVRAMPTLTGMSVQRAICRTIPRMSFTRS